MKNGAFSDYKVFTGNSHTELAEEIASIMGKTPGKSYSDKIQRWRDFREPLGICKRY